jgi:hypothetical protein
VIAGKSFRSKRKTRQNRPGLIHNNIHNLTAMMMPVMATVMSRSVGRNN